MEPNGMKAAPATSVATAVATRGARPGAVVAVVPPPSALPEPTLERQFVELYNRIHTPARDHAERFLNREDAEDAFGDATFVLWRRWHSLAPEQRTEKWMFGVVHRCVLAKRREINRYVSLDEADDELFEMARPDDPSASPSDAAALLDDCIARMPQKRREALLLVREQDFTYDEAAETLGVDYETVKSHLRHATENLRTAFARAGFRIESPRAQRLLTSSEDSHHD
jgi:RNA polymerase sigma factor (sigma-70 family)